MSNTFKSVLTIFAVSALMAGSTLAHGWGFNPPNPPFVGPVGGGSAPENTGPAGGGSTPGNSGPVGGGTTPAAAGAGGGSGPGGGRANGGAGGGGTTPRPPLAPPSGPPARTGGTTVARGGGAPTLRPRMTTDPWIDALTIDWVPEFLPVTKTDSYAAVYGTVEQALRQSPADGGWSRDGMPSLVLVYDASDAQHRKVIDQANKDARLRTASRFFKCFRVDAAPRSEGADGVRFLVFDAKGTSIGEVKGKARSSKIYDLMEKAYAGRDLGAACDKAEPLVKAVAQCVWVLKSAASVVACPDCGERREDVVDVMRKHRASMAEAVSRLDAVVRGS